MSLRRHPALPAKIKCRKITETKKAQGTGLPDFSWYNLPKREKYTKISTK
jgi:hypothetical protein